MYLGVDAYLAFYRAELWPFLRDESPLHSFPYLHFATRSFLVGFTWLGIVIAAWACIAAERCVTRKP